MKKPYIWTVTERATGKTVVSGSAAACAAWLGITPGTLRAMKSHGGGRYIVESQSPGCDRDRRAYYLAHREEFLARAREQYKRRMGNG